MKLSIIIPVFNEEKTVKEVLQNVHSVTLQRIKKEIIIVNDGSTDKTHQAIQSFLKKHPEIIYLKVKKNAGKGAAVKTGIVKASGDYILIQDADLEYNPEVIPQLLEPIMKKRTEVVYGTRLKRLPNFSQDERTVRFALHYLGNKMLSLLTSVLYAHWVSDMETCYKVFPRKFAQSISLHARGFEFEPEITAKLLKHGYKITEIPIKTIPRDYKEGKKLDTWKDGIKALKTIIYYRFKS